MSTSLSSRKSSWIGFEARRVEAAAPRHPFASPLSPGVRSRDRLERTLQLSRFSGSLHQSLSTSSSTKKTPSTRFEEGRALDDHQRRVATKLDRLASLAETYAQAPFESPFSQAPRGLYIHGGVGSGKTTMMNAFYESLSVPKKRIHLHEFLDWLQIEIHRAKQEMKALKLPPLSTREIVQEIGKALARENVVLAVDEFYVNDSAEAYLLSPLFEAMLRPTILEQVTSLSDQGERVTKNKLKRARGLILVATSNVPPRELAEATSAHADFQELFVEPVLLKHVRVETTEGVRDYRSSVSPTVAVSQDPSLRRQWTSEDPQGAFRALIPSDALANHGLVTGFERELVVPYVWSSGGKDGVNDVAGMPFEWLCGSILGRSRSLEDYTTLTKRFRTLVVGGVPRLRIAEAPRDVRDASRRFAHLLDLAYDNGVELILTTTEASPAEMFCFPSEDDESVDRADLLALRRAASRWAEMARAPRPRGTGASSPAL